MNLQLTYGKQKPVSFLRGLMKTADKIEFSDSVVCHSISRVFASYSFLKPTMSWIIAVHLEEEKDKKKSKKPEDKVIANIQMWQWHLCWLAIDTENEANFSVEK